MKPRISVIGTGRMGSALARAFLKQGYGTDIWNRTPSKCEPLAALGARIAPVVQDAVASAEVVVVNVNDYITSDRLLRSDEVTRALRGKLIIQLTSGTPQQAREMAAWAREHEIHYVDGAIMATPAFIGEPQCTILYSGPADLFENYKPVLLALGGNARYLGSDVGHASTLDIAMLSFMWAAIFGALQGVSVCEAEKLPLDVYISSIKPLMPLVDGWALGVIERIRDGRFAREPTTLATVNEHYAGIRHLLDLCKERGIQRALPAAFETLLQAAIKAGHGDDDFTIVNKFMR